ncbi:hypothetical protein ILYODFUR_011047 [Ilyodon furcidens]|uniref:Uncharacterized protein n=1 Tax=Ilyodon furcidens TaxID=33524 RepID=A0ABV0T8R7_9TELE
MEPGIVLSIPRGQQPSREAHFLILELPRTQGNHRIQPDQPECSKNSRQAVYRKWTTSLLCSTSIKGYSEEDFLEGVRELVHCPHPPSLINQNRNKLIHMARY